MMDILTSRAGQLYTLRLLFWEFEQNKGTEGKRLTKHVGLLNGTNTTYKRCLSSCCQSLFVNDEIKSNMKKTPNSKDRSGILLLHRFVIGLKTPSNLASLIKYNFSSPLKETSYSFATEGTSTYSLMHLRYCRFSLLLP